MNPRFTRSRERHVATRRRRSPRPASPTAPTPRSASTRPPTWTRSSRSDRRRAPGHRPPTAQRRRGRVRRPGPRSPGRRDEPARWSRASPAGQPVVLSARFSWTNPMVALISRTIPMTIGSLMSPTANDTTAAPSRMYTIRLRNWSMKRFHAGRRGASSSSLPPKRSSRSATSPASSPRSRSTPSRCAVADGVRRHQSAGSWVRVIFGGLRCGANAHVRGPTVPPAHPRPSPGGARGDQRVGYPSCRRTGAVIAATRRRSDSGSCSRHEVSSLMVMRPVSKRIGLPDTV